MVLLHYSSKTLEMSLQGSIPSAVYGGSARTGMARVLEAKCFLEHEDFMSRMYIQ